jgi:hypothetical protein
MRGLRRTVQRRGLELRQLPAQLGARGHKEASLGSIGTQSRCGIKTQSQGGIETQS